MAASDDVLRAIPHREPFLFVDRIVEHSEGRIVTERTLREDEPQFLGHYPGAPLMPGVLLCEAVFQTGAILLTGMASAETPPNAKPVLTRIREAKFRNMARPGETISVEVVLDEKMGGAYLMTGRVSSNGKNILRVGFVVAMVDLKNAAT